MNKQELKKKIGQLFIIGYQGEEPDADFLKFVEEWGIGGVIVFARNLSDPEKLPGHLEKIAKASGQKIFTSIDQEGGLVLRILSKGSLFPSAMGLAATADPALIQKMHCAMGREMLSLGLNWNLAPVLDINHPDNPGIGARSFGDTPQQVAEYGVAAIKGLQQANVLACAKHFPGKGHAQVDSHLTLPVIPYPAEHLDSFELHPFKKAIENGVDAIMTAHVFFPAFEKAKDLPATLSKSVLTGLLRDRLGFKGILVTDDLEMGAITESFGIAQAANLSFQAGADLLLICHRLDQQRLAAETILEQVTKDPASAIRLEQSLERIAIARNKLVDKNNSANLHTLQETHKPLIEQAYEQSIRFLRVNPGFLPLKNSTADPVFILPQISSLVQVEEEHQQGSLKAIIEKDFPGGRFVIYDPKGSSQDLIKKIEDEGRLKPDSSGKIVFFTYNSHILKGQHEAVQYFSRQTAQMMVIALRNPFDLADCKNVRTCAATFGFRTPAIKAVLRVLKGEQQPRLTPWPISIKGWN